MESSNSLLSVDGLSRDDIRLLSDMCFKELSERANRFFSAMNESSTDARADIGELKVILRCCFSILPSLLFDQKLVLEKGQILLAIVGKLLSFDVTIGENGCIVFKEFRRECTIDEDGLTTSVAEGFVASLSFVDPSVRFRPLLCALLEVIADELLSDGYLRECLISINSALCMPGNLFVSGVNHQNIGVVFEVIGAHFMLHTSGDQGIEQIFDRLSGRGRSKVLELHLPQALSLLLNPIMLSSPGMLQAHLMILTAESIDMYSSQKRGFSCREIDWYFTAFERSINLYSRHAYRLYANDHSLGEKSLICYLDAVESGQLCFGSFIREVTRERIDQIAAASINLWESYVSNVTVGSNANLLSASFTYLRENKDLLDKSCKDSILSVLTCIVSKAFPDVQCDAVTLRKGNRCSLDIYLLSSMKLIGASMMQVVRHLKHYGDTDHLRTIDNSSLSKLYHQLLSVVRCFQQFDISFPVQSFICEQIASHPLRHKESISMLLHFSRILSLCFACGLDTPIKVCLDMMMTVMNFITLEEGTLTELSSLLLREPECKDEEPVELQNCRREVALTFQKVKRQCLSNNSVNITHSATQANCEQSTGNVWESSQVVHGDQELRTEETCDGEIFLKCLLEGSNNYNDLADFIDLKRGKDYFMWLKNKERYRRRKFERTAVLRWKKRTMTWRMKRKST